MKTLIKRTFLGKILLNLRNRLYNNLAIIEEDKVSKKLSDGWKSLEIPHKQTKITDSELTKMYSGLTIKPFQVLADCINLIKGKNSSIIEVGCSTGFYYEVLSYLLENQINYTGVDYSAAMIDEAHKRYENVTFKIGDATNLAFKNQEFDIVISGCCLLHIPNYSKAISESARISRQWVVFHKTPVVKGSTQYFQKKAYGVPCLEIHFNEYSFIELCKRNQLSLRHTFDIDVPEDGELSWKTYVFEKINLKV